MSVDKVEPQYRKAEKNCFHLFLDAPSGYVQLPYSIKAQTIKLIGARVVLTATGTIDTLFLQTSFISGNQAMSNLAQGLVPIPFNSNSTDSYSYMGLKMTCNSDIKKDIKFSLVDMDGVLVGNTLDFVHLIFEYEASRL